MPRGPRGERKQQILEALARMLEENHGQGVTTAALAKEVEVSEAALYRHFASKAKIFEGLIDFIEESLFTRISLILEEERRAEPRTHQIVTLVLAFADKNPGISRIMQGDALLDEPAKLRERIMRLFDRIETQLKQVLREGELEGSFQGPVTPTARLMNSVMQGHIAHYVRTGFRDSPVAHWPEQWEALRGSLFVRH